MSYFSNIYDSRHIKSRKALSVFLSFVLVFSMSNLTASANEATPLNGVAKDASKQASEEPAEAVSSGSIQSAEVDSTQDQEVLIRFDLEHAYAFAGDQLCASNNLYAPLNKEFSFQIEPEEGYEIASITAEYATSATPVQVNTEQGISKIDSSAMTDDVNVVVQTTKKEDAPVASTEENSSLESQSLEQSSVQKSPVKKGTQTLSIVPSESGDVQKWTGEELDAVLFVGLQNTDGAIIAIPRTPFATIEVGGLPAGAASGFVDTSLLAGVSGIDMSYEQYFLIVLDNRSASAGSGTLNTFDISFGFNKELTPAGETQPIEGYIIAGVEASESGLLGSSIAFADEAEATKASAGTSLTSKVETLALEKTVQSIEDGNLSADDLDAALINRPYADAGSYEITYKLALTAERSGEKTGRQYLERPVTVRDELSGFLAAGKPQKITLSGPGVKKTISQEEIEAGTNASGTSYVFSFEAPLSSGGVLSNAEYMVTVEYEKDAYTNLYQEAPSLTERVQIENKAWMEYSSKAYGSVSTSNEASSANNALGYTQLPSDEVALKVQKKVLVNGELVDYSSEYQSRYSAENGNKVTFELTGTSGKGKGNVLSGSVDKSGVVLLSGLKENSTYTLKETVGIKNFNKANEVVVTVGALENDIAPITIAGEDDDFGAADARPYAVTNKALYDGSILVTAEKQALDTSGASHDFVLLRYHEVTLYQVVVGEDGTEELVEVMSAKTDLEGKVKFANLDPSLKYVVKGAGVEEGYTATVSEVAFNTQKEAEVSLQYLSTSGRLNVGKVFNAPDGGTIEGYVASFELVNKNDPSKVYAFNINADGSEKRVPYLIEPGEYVLNETGVIPASATERFELVAGIPVTIEEGKFDTTVGVLTNETTYGQIKIKNYDYSNTPLSKGEFEYTLTHADGTTVTVVLPEGASEIVVDVPEGQYTVEQTKNPERFLTVANSGAVVVARETAPVDNMSVSGTNVETFDFEEESVQTVGIVNATLPLVSTTKVSTEKEDNKPLANAGFQVQYTADGVTYETIQDGINTGFDGKITSKHLKEGHYRFFEKYPPAGYIILDDQQTLDFEVSTADYAKSTEAKEIKLDQQIKNAPKQYLSIRMASTEKGGFIPGATFNLYSESGDLIAWANSTSSYYVTFSDNNGAVNLVPGTYTIKQDSFAEGSLAEENFVPRFDTVVTVVVGEDGALSSVTFDGDKYANSSASINEGKINFSNVPKPKMNLFKTGDTNVFDLDGNRTNESLAGAVFELYEISEGVSKGVIVVDDKKVGLGEATKLTTPASGQIAVEGLDPTKTYTLKEVSAPQIEGTDFNLVPAADTSVSFAVETNDAGEIVRYVVQGADDNTITLNNVIEDVYQLQLSKYGLSDSKVYTDCPGAKFAIQKKVGENEWVTVEVIITGTGNPDDLNTALTGMLTEGTYRVVEIGAPPYSPELDEDNILYGTNGDPEDRSSWTEVISDSVEVVLNNGTTESGLVFGREFTLGAGGYNQEVNEIAIGNSDLRNDDEEDPGEADALYIQLHGSKQVFSYDENNEALDEVLGVASGIKFNVWYGYQTEDGQVIKLGEQLADVTSGSVQGEPGGFITEYVLYKAEEIPANATPCFIFTEVGPTPGHLIQPQSDNQVVVPVEIPENLNQRFYTINYEDNTDAVIKNFMSDSILTINKYSLESGNRLKAGIFNIYLNDNDAVGELVETVDLSVSAELPLTKGSYYVEEISAPSGYNPNGEYSVNGKKKGEFDSDVLLMELEVDQDGATALDVYDTPFASLEVFDYWGGDDNPQLSNGRNANYSLSYHEGDYLDAYLENHTQAEEFEVFQHVRTTIADLPDGVYMLFQKEVYGSKVDTLHHNPNVTDYGVKITIQGGAATLVEGSMDGSTWEPVNGLEDKNEKYPYKHNVTHLGNTIGINHLYKSILRLSMGYVDASGNAFKYFGDIIEAEFEITKIDDPSSTQTITWYKTEGEKEVNQFTDYYLDSAIYEMVQTSVTVDPQSDKVFFIDPTPVYFEIAGQGYRTAVGNNTSSYTEGLPAIELASSKNEPHYGGGLTRIYNRENKGHVKIVKQDSSLGEGKEKYLEGATFELKKGDLVFTGTTDETGTILFENVPVDVAEGSNYTLTETVTPEGYHVDTTPITVLVKPNGTNEFVVENVPQPSITIYKEAQAPSFVDENGVTQNGEVHAVYGLNINLYKDGELSASGTTDSLGMCEFKNLEPGEYRVEEEDNLDYLDVAGNTQYNSTNPSTHFTVEYTESSKNEERASTISYAAGVEVDEENAVLTIRNKYDDSALILPVKKVDAQTGEVLEGAHFILTDANGTALAGQDNFNNIVAQTNENGMAFFQIVPDKIFLPGETSSYKGDYYVKEFQAPEGYIVSPYAEDNLQLVSFVEGSSQAEMLVFENLEAQEITPVVEKETDSEIEAPLTQAGFEATYTINQQALENTVPLKDYTVVDEGITFKDASGTAVVDSRLTYTVDSITIGKSTVASGDDVYASIDGGQTWTLVSSAPQVFNVDLATTSENAEPLFEIWYAEKAANGSYVRLLSEGFTPGTITVEVTFDRFVMDKDEATANEVKTIVNTAHATAQLPTNKENEYEEVSSESDASELELPGLPTMEVSKTLLSDSAEVTRGGEIQYELTLTNTSDDKTVKNPVIIDRVKPIDLGGSFETPMSIKADAMENPGVDALNFVGNGSALSYDSAYGIDGLGQVDESVAYWVFTGELAPQASITITVTATLNQMIPANQVTNQIFGGAVLNPADLTQSSDFYSKDNPSGAFFAPSNSGATASQEEYEAVQGSTGINSGLYVTDEATSKIKTSSKISAQKGISNTGSNWQEEIDVLPGEDFYYSLQVNYDAAIGEAALQNIEILEVTPQNGDISGTTWTNDLISDLQFSNLAVWGFDATDGYKQLVEGTDYEAFYSNATDYSTLENVTATEAGADDTSFKSFKIVLHNNIEVKGQQFVTATYKATVPTADDTVGSFTYAALANNIGKSGVSQFKTAFSVSGSKQSVDSNDVAAHLLAPSTSLEGRVWDDKNRDGAYENPENGAYTRDTVDFGEVTVVLYKDSKDGNGFVKENETLVNADGTYSFENLVTSYGNNAPTYKVEFIYEQGSSSASRGVTHQFSQGTAFANDGEAALSNVMNVTTVGGSTSISGDSGEISLLLQNANIVNAGINAIPYNVSYDYGTAPDGASALPGSEEHVFGDVITVAPPATAPGYDFIGWSHSDDFDMPAEDVVISGTWVARGDTPYRVEYYFQDVNGSGYYIDNAQTINGQGKTDTTLNALIKSFTGFTHNPQAAGTLLTDTIRGDGSTVLKVYYDRSMYTVSYVYTGTVPPAAPGVPTQATYYYGQNVNVAGEPSLDGYTFSGWSRTGSFTMPAAEVVIYGSWELIPVAPIVTPEVTPEEPTEEPTEGPVEEQTFFQNIVDTAEQAIAGLVETLLGDEETPLAQGEGKHCWIHPWIIFGIILTLIYAVLVLVRRRKFTRDLDDYENQIFNEEQESKAPSTTAQPRFNGPLGAEG